MSKKTEHHWGLCHGNALLPFSIRTTRHRVITEYERLCDRPWHALRKAGYRTVKVACTYAKTK